MRIALLILMLPFIATGQNLVPNGSFEVLDSCPSGNFCGGQIELASGWYEATTCTVDLFHVCASTTQCSIPQGTVYPYVGDGMARVALLTVGPLANGFREYLSIELTETLEMDTAYQLRVALRSLDAGSISVGSIGAYFSSDSATHYFLDHELLNLEPQLQRNPDSIMDNPDIWYIWEDTLIANGAERFIMFGNFLSDFETPYSPSSQTGGGGCYLDDVSLTKITKPNSIRELDVKFGVLPNPSNGLVSINYNGNLTPMAMTLLTVEGRQVFSEPWHRQLDVSSLSEGIYLLRVEFENGAVGTQRLVVKR
jgi:hypothetical protein